MRSNGSRFTERVPLFAPVSSLWLPDLTFDRFILSSREVPVLDATGQAPFPPPRHCKVHSVVFSGCSVKFGPVACGPRLQTMYISVGCYIDVRLAV